MQCLKLKMKDYTSYFTRDDTTFDVCTIWDGYSPMFLVDDVKLLLDIKGEHVLDKYDKIWLFNDVDKFFTADVFFKILIKCNKPCACDVSKQLCEILRSYEKLAKKDVVKEIIKYTDKADHVTKECMLHYLYQQVGYSTTKPDLKRHEVLLNAHKMVPCLMFIFVKELDSNVCVIIAVADDIETHLAQLSNTYEVVCLLEVFKCKSPNRLEKHLIHHEKIRPSMKNTKLQAFDVMNPTAIQVAINIARSNVDRFNK